MKLVMSVTSEKSSLDALDRLRCRCWFAASSDKDDPPGMSNSLEAENKSMFDAADDGLLAVAVLLGSKLATFEADALRANPSRLSSAP